MREILFRGKRIDDGEWVYGDFIHEVKKQKGMAFIWSENETTSPWEVLEFAVNPTTVGQFTGLTDKNGKRIFEGDIVRARLEEGTHAGFEWPLMRIEYRDAAFTLVDKLGRAFCTMAALAPNVGLEVLGNVHDNHELMEV